MKLLTCMAQDGKQSGRPADVVVELHVVDVDGVRADAIEERHVVRDHDQGLWAEQKRRTQKEPGSNSGDQKNWARIR